MSDAKQVHEFMLENTYEASIAPIRECFDFVSQERGNIHIKLRRNTGGNLVPVFELIESIRHSDFHVTVSAERYIFSAAAVFYFELYFGKKDGGFKNVDFEPLEEPILVLFHKPRNVIGKFIRFPDEEKQVRVSAIPLELEGQSRRVDQVFRRFLHEEGCDSIRSVPGEEEFNGMKHMNQHVLDAWLNNFDCIFEWSFPAIDARRPI